MSKFIEVTQGLNQGEIKLGVNVDRIETVVPDVPNKSGARIEFAGASQYVRVVESVAQVMEKISRIGRTT